MRIVFNGKFFDFVFVGGPLDGTVQQNIQEDPPSPVSFSGTRYEKISYTPDDGRPPVHFFIPVNMHLDEALTLLLTHYTKRTLDDAIAILQEKGAKK